MRILRLMGDSTVLCFFRETSPETSPKKGAGQHRAPVIRTDETVVPKDEVAWVADEQRMAVGPKTAARAEKAPKQLRRTPL
jgi:hypothetical protein